MKRASKLSVMELATVMNAWPAAHKNEIERIQQRAIMDNEDPDEAVLKAMHKDIRALGKIKCNCGRTISANKTECFTCFQKRAYKVQLP